MMPASPASANHFPKLFFYALGNKENEHYILSTKNILFLANYIDLLEAFN